MLPVLRAEPSSPFVLGLIPARGGSKGVPRKNVRSLGGQPLLVFTIQAALSSRWLSRVATSTEDAEIATVARRAGSVVIDRPADLARDETPTLPVVQHAVEYIERTFSRALDYVVILQATTPFRSGSDIDGAVEKLMQTGAHSVVSVCSVTRLHPWKLKKIIDDQLVPYLDAEPEGTRRQDLPAVYVRNGGIYAVRRDVLMEQHSIFGQDCRPYVMPPERSVEIDDEMDLITAQALLEWWK